MLAFSFRCVTLADQADAFQNVLVSLFGDPVSNQNEEWIQSRAERSKRGCNSFNLSDFNSVTSGSHNRNNNGGKHNQTESLVVGAFIGEQIGREKFAKLNQE